MTVKVCQVVFSTNRLEYLIPTLNHQRNLNYEGCEVHKIFFDDYPKGRNNQELTQLVQSYGFNEIILHEENKGLSATWSECWDLLKTRDYDYIFHHEDDVLILQPVKILDLIEFLKNNEQLTQLCLARQPWYFHEHPCASKDIDHVINDIRIEIMDNNVFSPLASLYSTNMITIPIKEIFNINLNEGMIALFLKNTRGMTQIGLVKNREGKNLVEHIGEWFVGKRVLSNEPGYEYFAHFDPDKKYYSRDGREYDK